MNTSLTAIPNQETERLAWLKWRKAGIGGSDAAAILGEDPWRTALDVYIDKSNDTITDSDNLILQRGICMEPLASDRYAVETGRKVRRQPPKVHQVHDFIRCTIDRQIVNDDRGPGVLELKTANSFVFRSMKMTGIPTKYWVQVQHNLMVWNYSWGAIGVLCPDTWQFIHFDIEADKDFQAMLLDREVEFWRLVENQTPPDSTPATREKLPTVGGEVVLAENLDAQLGKEYRQMVEALDTFGQLKDEATTMYDRAKGAAQEWMLRHQFDVVEGHGRRVYYKEQAGRKTLDKKALIADNPTLDLAKYQKTGAPFRSFRVYKVDEQSGLPAATEVSA